MSNLSIGLITGSHKSGTTWVGKIIGTHSKYGYIHEPFNLNNLPCLKCKFEAKKWFPHYSSSQAKVKAFEHVKHLLRFEYAPNILRTERLGQLKKATKTKLSFWKNKANKVKPIIKDPLALFSLNWYVNNFQVKPVVLIRHPAAFVGSLKRAKWSFPFSHLRKTNNPHLNGFENEIQRFSRTKQNIVDQAILLWRIFHKTILTYKKNHPEWLYPRHEDLSYDPIKEFEVVFRYLGVEYEEKVKEKIRKLSYAKHKKYVKKSIQRDSKSNIFTWKKRLTSKEIEKVKRKTKDIWQKLYSEKEW